MPSFIDRLEIVGRSVIGLFSENSSRQAFGLLQSIWPGRLGEAPTRGARERIAAFADMPWLHALADKVAFAMAAVDWQIGAVRPQGAERAIRAKALQTAPAPLRRAMIARLKQAGEFVPAPETHPFYALFQGGNPFMTGLGMRYVTFLHMDLEGEAFWLKERGIGGVPVGAWPLPPDWVRATPTPADRFFRVGFRGWQGPIPETEIIWMPRHNPSNPYGRGTGIVRSLADELESDEMAARTVRQSFLNQMRPDFIVYPKNVGNMPGHWTDAQVQRLRHDWEAQHTGFWRAFKARFASHEIGIHEFTEKSFREQQMVQLRDSLKDTIRQVWGVPPEIMGIVEPGSSRATIARASFLFAKYVLVPRLEMFRALLQERLLPEYDDRLVIDYTSPIEEDREFALEAHKSMSWAWTVDEHRALANDAPLSDGRGERFLVPFTMTPMTDFGDGAPAEEEALALAGIKTDELRALRRLVWRER